MKERKMNKIEVLLRLSIRHPYLSLWSLVVGTRDGPRVGRGKKDSTVSNHTLG